MPFDKLFAPGRIGPLELKNRAVMVPMSTEYADEQGRATPQMVAYYEARARGGVGLIINEYTGVDDVDSLPSPHYYRMAQDDHIAPARLLTEAVHRHGCKIFAQLHHAGATSKPALTGRENLAPSDVPMAPGGLVPRPMTLEEIARVREKFIAAAVRCRDAGYDGVELHGAHSYLLAQFASKYYNRRTDEYGGSLENRLRLIGEIIDGIRARLGDFPLSVRICGDEMTSEPGFLTLEDGLEIGRFLEQKGIDCINISNGSAWNANANCDPYSYQPGWKKHVAKAFKEALSIPVIATNTVKTPDFAQQLLEEGVCDFVGLGRAQFADPEFIRKAAQGRTDEIRGCIGCMFCRECLLMTQIPIQCAVNPLMSREYLYPSLPEDGVGRAAVVVGGGPAGMEGARVLALRGFRVTLFEKEAVLGGNLNIASRPPFKGYLADLGRTMETQIRRLGVEIRTGTPATVEAVSACEAQVILLACGAEPVRPRLPGADLPHVLLAEDVILGRAQPAGRVAVVGSGLTGLEAAEVLLERGHPVDLVELQKTLGPGLFPVIFKDIMGRITPHNPGLYPGHALTEIHPCRILLREEETGKPVELPADTVVLALGVRPRRALAEQFQAAFPGRVLLVGDAEKGGRIRDAILSAFLQAAQWKAE